MSQVVEEFELWLKTGFKGPFRLGPHRFEKTKNGGVRVDGSVFTREEARTLVEMLTSSNLFYRLSASMAILERSGILKALLILGALVLVLLVYIWVKR